MFDLYDNDRSNNTNKLSPQEPRSETRTSCSGSNNTNKLSPQEQIAFFHHN